MWQILPKVSARFIALSLLAGVLSATTAPVRAAAPVILVLGDSLSAAYGMALEQGWVALLQQRLTAQGQPSQVVNASISGDTTAGGLARLPDLLVTHRPALVIIELGANDGLRGFTPAQIAGNLTRLIHTAQASGARVVLIGVLLPPNYGQAYTERFQQMYAEVAAATGAALVTGFLTGVADQPDLMQADGLHPLPAAQPRMLERVWGVLEGQL